MRKQLLKTLLSKRAEGLLRKMRESGELCCIDISSDHDFTWEVTFARSSGSSHMFEGPVISYSNLNSAIEDAYRLWKGTYKGYVTLITRSQSTVELKEIK